MYKIFLILLIVLSASITNANNAEHLDTEVKKAPDFQEQKKDPFVKLERTEYNQKIAQDNLKESKKQTNTENTFFDATMFLSTAILTFSLMVFGLMTYLIKIGNDPELILKTFGSILIIVSAVFLIIAGYSEQQISPVIGLLGTVAGYILGKSSNKKE